MDNNLVLKTLLTIKYSFPGNPQNPISQKTLIDDISQKSMRELITENAEQIGVFEDSLNFDFNYASFHENSNEIIFLCRAVAELPNPPHEKTFAAASRKYVLCSQGKIFELKEINI